MGPDALARRRPRAETKLFFFLFSVPVARPVVRPAGMSVVRPAVIPGSRWGRLLVAQLVPGGQVPLGHLATAARALRLVAAGGVSEAGREP